MLISEVRPCDACKAPVKTIVYAITVQALVHTPAEELLKPVGTSIDLQICARCSCGLTTHALPLALEHRTQALDQQRRAEHVARKFPESSLTN